jgi:alkylation response protein AidB-like acyl-CoA dehydrogenase
MSYRAPVEEIAFTLNQVAGLRKAMERGEAGDLTPDLLDAILDEAGKFAAGQLAPLNQIGDTQGSTLVDGAVRTPDGWKDVYRQWAEAGWGGLAAPAEFGGQELPIAVAVAVSEIWNSACLAFSLGPVLTFGAVEAIAAHATPQLKQAYLDKLVSGEWMATMNLTEPQAGSDLSAMRTKAVPQGDGSYLISGTKIFISYGDHDLTDNIVHLVLARLPGAPPGTRGISLFLVPKRMVGPDGSPGEANDVKVAGVEHKLGIHASPTCVMSFGEEHGAIGYLVGEENKGLACMFTMMNNARLNVGIQGVAIAERAYQQALAYALERRQGRAPGAPGEDAANGMSVIAEHPDVRRMLLTMRAKTQAARAICYMTAAAIDRGTRAHAEGEREDARLLANLLTPVAKAFSTDIGVEVASIGIQVHGGMGYVEETGAAQHLRDARITPIYEGTNGIQAMDLVGRKLPQRGGEHVREFIEALGAIADRAMAVNDPSFGRMGYRLSEAVKALDTATDWMLQTLQSEDASPTLASAAPYLKLFGLTAGGAFLADGACMLAGEMTNGEARARGRIATARHFCENLLIEAEGLQRSVVRGADAVLGTSLEQLAV